MLFKKNSILIEVLEVEFGIVLEVGNLSIFLESLGSCRWNLFGVLLNFVVCVFWGFFCVSFFVVCGG